MHIDRTYLMHRLAAIAAGLGFAALAFGVIARLHMIQHHEAHDSGHCPTCVSLSGQVKQVDPGAIVQAQAGQTPSESIQPIHETPVLSSPSFRLNTRSPPLSLPL